MRDDKKGVILPVLLLLVYSLGLTSCGVKDGADRSSLPTVTYEPIDTTIQPEKVQDAAAGANDSGKAADEAGDASKKDNDLIVHSATEYLQLADTEWLDHEADYLGTEAIAAYDTFLTDEVKKRREEADNYQVRMALGLVDDDASPELFLGYSTCTPCGVLIYTYDEEDKKVYPVGEFSQYGFCRYTEKKNSIWSQYGNQGCFRICFSEFHKDRVSLIGALIDDDLTYYAGFPVRDDITGEQSTTMDNFELPSDDYIVSDDVYSKLYGEYERFDTSDKPRVLEVHYKDMIRIEPEE